MKSGILKGEVLKKTWHIDFTENGRQQSYMTSQLAEKLSDVRDFRKILETTVKEIGENYSADVSQIILSNPLDSNFTSICEYLANPEETPDDLPSTTFPVHLEGGGLGLLSVSRQQELAVQEINEIRLTLADIADILRYAQINDLVQRDTFRSAFMSEITNLMSLPMGLGDALFMVVNILGKALAVSRCIFICVDDSKSAWKSYEYWQRERVESAQDFGWPTKDSAIVSQTLLSAVPISTFEGQINSYKTPVQEEMEFIGVRSQLSVAIRSSSAVHGAIILHQCESRHAWTRDEIDIVQSVADTVAEALAQLPEEKKDLEPIMRLYQHDVAATKDESNKKNTQEIRRALKGALGTASIPKAQKSKAPEPATPPAPPPTVPQQQSYQQEVNYQEAAYTSAGYNGQEGTLDPYAQQYAQTAPDAAASYGNELAAQSDAAAYNDGPSYAGAEQFGIQKTHQGTSSQSAASMWGDTQTNIQKIKSAGGPPADMEGELGNLADIITEHANQEPSGAQPGAARGALGGIMGARSAANTSPAWQGEVSMPQPPPPGPALPLQQMAQAHQANQYHDDPSQAATQQMPGTDSNIPLPGSVAQQQGKAASKWGNLDDIPTPGATGGAQPPPPGPAAAKPASKWGNLDEIPAPGAGGGPSSGNVPAAKPASKWGNLDDIPSPGSPGQAAASTGGVPVQPKALSGQWGDLDSIPSPAGQNRGPGLGGLMMGKAKAAAPTGPSGLGNAFMKGKGPQNSPQFVEGPPIQIDEAAAEAKLKQILASSNPTSDFIFATPGVDMRLLGRIDGYVTQVEAKDKYVNGHARAVAEYSVAIARLLGLSPEEVNQIRLAAILHDVGKMGLPQNLLQKPDEQLSDSELVMMMNHTINGAKLLEGFPELAPLAPIVLSHHEEFNGQGYPQGEAGEAIPLGARIIQTANAYNEMVSDLVYRAGMAPEQAQTEMIRGSGKSYDPNVVEALIACISQGLVPPRF